MRLPLLLSIGVCILIAGAAWAQNAGGIGTGLQVPVGQTFKNFEFPIYQDGKLKFTLTAAAATGVTQNRADAMDVKIQIYDNGTPTTTITSPRADLFVSERKMRTKDTVLIQRADMDATAQSCDFDLTNKKYLLRTRVKVILKHFDAGSVTSPGGSAAPSPTPARAATPEVSTTPASALPALTPRRAPNNDSLLDSPGAYSSTNSAPSSPNSTDTP